MRALILAVPLLTGLAGLAVAQPVPHVPFSGVPAEDKPSTFLRAAQGALATGRKADAHEALEMAQTRLLDRSVPPGRTNDPSSNPLVSQISRAIQALNSGDRLTCMQSIQDAIASSTAEGL